MIYSKSAEYAIRASIHLAQLPNGQTAMVKDIAREEDIPAPFLAKILQDLARKGFLRSVKGPSGGFSMKRNAADVRLLDIVDAVDGLEHYGKCIAGFSECSNRAACPLHDSWMTLHSRIMDYLGRNTIGSLVRSLEIKRKTVAKLGVGSRESKKTLRTSL
jgi:Rrf2 family iron-sulfur cluster assembly transcriptional regulator